MKKETRKGKKKLAMTIFACGAAMIAVIAAIMRNASLGQMFLKIDGNSFGEEAYNWAVFSARDDVLLSDSTSENEDSGDISESFYEDVAERAVKILQEYYAVSSLAVECGYLQDPSFTALMEELEEENEKRRADIADGQVVTGLASYDLDQYIQYRAETIRRQYCADSSNPGMDITESEMRQRYEKDKTVFYTQEDDLDLYYIEINTGEMRMSAQEAEALESEVAILREEAVECGSLKDALEKAPELRQYCNILSVDGAEYASYARTYVDLLSYAEGLDTGDISELINENGNIFLIECTARVKNDYVSFENAFSMLERSVREDRYNDLIRERIAQQTVMYDADMLYRYTKQQLGGM